jgi:hypothetical protein
LVFDETQSSMLGKTANQLRLQFLAVGRLRQRRFGEFQIHFHLVVLLGAARQAMASKNATVRKAVIFVQRVRPFVEISFAEEKVNLVIYKILRDQYVLVGQAYGKGGFGFRVPKNTKIELATAD